MPSFDRGFKIVARAAGRQLAGLAHVVCTSWHPIVSEVQAVEPLADRAFRAARGRERFVVYMEAYTYWEEAVPWSVLAKSGLLAERERLPVVSLVFYLRSDGNRPLDGGASRLEAPGEPTQQVWPREVRLWEEVPDTSWEGVPGLMALYPLCRHSRPPRQAVTHAAAAIARASGSARERADLLTALGIFGRLAYPDLDVFTLIAREQMKEAPVYREIMDEGRVEARREDILDNLEARFGTEAAEQVRADVQTVESLARLGRLHRLSVLCAELATFRAVLREERPPAPPHTRNVDRRGGERMRESPAYEEIRNEGRVEVGRSDILVVLEERFGREAAEQVRADVQAIDDLTRLERLYRLLVRCSGLAAFREGLQRGMPPPRRTR
jgi:hypothetical protein